MTIPLIDLVAQYRSIQAEIDGALRDVLAAGIFILGPQVAALETEVAAYLGTRHAVGVASGTDALVLALRACGIDRGHEVIVPSYTFFATAEAVSLCGARPVFVDIDPQTYCLDVRQVEARLSAQTRAVIPVHLYGHPAEMGPLLDLARAKQFAVIEDNAQAIGAEYRGRKTGGLGDAGCLSFFPSKNLGGYGDGGMVVTNDPGLADTVRRLRTHGWQRKYHPETIGVNSRLDELQAAVLRVKLRHLEQWTARRRSIADRYRDLLAGAPLGVPQEAPHARHVYHLFVVRVKGREAVQHQLRARGIASGVYYPLPLHRLAPYIEPGPYPEADRAAAETLAIPLFPEMTDEQIGAVAAAVGEASVAAVATGP